MIHENTFKKIEFHGAKGLIFLGDKVLVYRRDTKTKKYPGCIDMIGGGREGDETPFETFSREVKEEVGLEIKEEDIHFSCPFQSNDDPTMISFFFVTKPLGFKESDVRFGNEGTEWFTMTPEEFIGRPDGIERQQKRVRDYLEGRLGKEIMETQNSKSFELAKPFLGKEVEVIFDRPLGSKHPKYGFIYEVNYGYIEGVKAPDGEDLDAYYLGTDQSLQKAEGIVKAIVHRLDNDDDKLVVMPKDMSMTDEEINQAVNFQEQWFKHQILR